jgi:hypothetical protein
VPNRQITITILSFAEDYNQYMNFLKGR